MVVPNVDDTSAAPVEAAGRAAGTSAADTSACGSRADDVMSDVMSELTSLVAIPGGEFTMGSNDHYPEEGPTHRVRVSDFEIEQHQVTNAQFRRFVEATGYVTVAERPLDPTDYPGVPTEHLQPGSLVFVPTAGPVDLGRLDQWWAWTPGACWRQPEGPGSTIEDRLDHPVVQVAYEDAEAYASWAGRVLPTEAQWERAARGGLEGAEFTWGDEEYPEGPTTRMAKYYRGKFPYSNEPLDGFERTAPVGSFPSNAFGLADMAGNVWEWTQDWYEDRAEAHRAGRSPDAGKTTDQERACCVPTDPRGPAVERSFDRSIPQFPIPRRVIKGGSHLCAIEYCQRYRPAARRPQMIDTGMGHIGFRCAGPAKDAVT